MIRRTSILVALLPLLGAISSLWAQPGDASRSTPSERPNIVFAFADDWGVHGGTFGAEGETVSDFVNLLDLAPTFLEAAGISPPSQMTGRSLLDLLRAENDGRTEAHRSHTLLAKERHHGRARIDGTGYPMRAIRTTNYLYIRNYRPDRWPQGAPRISSSQWIFSDTDDGPTKRWMIAHANEPDVQPLFRQTFAKRPAEELYDLRSDPHQLTNVADEAAYEAVKAHLSMTLRQELRALDDPRLAGHGDQFDNSPYYTDYGSERVDPPASVKEALDLE